MGPGLGLQSISCLVELATDFFYNIIDILRFLELVTTDYRLNNPYTLPQKKADSEEKTPLLETRQIVRKAAKVRTGI